MIFCQSKWTVAKTLRKLEDKGYIERIINKDNRRKYILKLTKKGFEALKIHDQFHKELADLYQSAIPEEHVEWLLQTLGQIKINLDNYRQELEDK